MVILQEVKMRHLSRSLQERLSILYVTVWLHWGKDINDSVYSQLHRGLSLILSFQIFTRLWRRAERWCCWTGERPGARPAWSRTAQLRRNRRAWSWTSRPTGWLWRPAEHLHGDRSLLIIKYWVSMGDVISQQALAVLQGLWRPANSLHPLLFQNAYKVMFTLITWREYESRLHKFDITGSKQAVQFGTLAFSLFSPRPLPTPRPVEWLPSKQRERFDS